MPDEIQTRADNLAAAANLGYEPRDAKVGGIITFIVGLVVFLTFTQFAMWGLLTLLSGGKPEPADPLTPHATAHRQHEILRRAEDATLNRYGWANPDAAKAKSGPVQIPIERAIDLLAERGVPAATGPAQTEVQVNSHSGTAPPAENRKHDEPAPDRKGTPEPTKGATP